jgi:hypothetical protein
VSVNKVNWSQVGRVAEPGRYMYKFGWLTITAEELAVWKQYPSAAFTLYRPASAETEDDFRLGAFELPETHPSDGT